MVDVVASDRRSDAPLTLEPLETQPRSLTDQVIAAILEAAHSGDLVPGALYSTFQISSLLGVSRAPVREALIRLSEVGRVRIERNRGFRFVAPSAREVAEIFHLRLLLEVPAARAAASRHTSEQDRSLARQLTEMRKTARAQDEPLFVRQDREFHNGVLEMAGNQRLAAVVAGLREASREIGVSNLHQSRTLTDITDEHLAIARAIAEGDAEGAARNMRNHVTRTGRLLVAQALRADDDPSDPDALWQEVVGPEGAS